MRPDSIARPLTTSGFLYQVRVCILRHLDNDAFGVAELADALFISRTQLFRRIRTLTGYGVARYLRRLRIEEAQKLLTATDLSITEVAYRTGFCDPSYLRRVFLLETGETLAGYRRRVRGSVSIIT